MQDKSGKYHLWILISDPIKKKDSQEKVCVLVNASTIQCPSKQCSTILSQKDHSFITTRSYIRCDHSRIISLAKLESLFKTKKIRYKESLLKNILDRIQATVLSCRRSPKEVKGLIVTP